jgi:1-acyl-sn-glycerol-3-phosphate acyltransferase
MKFVAGFDLKKVGFSYEKKDMERLLKNENAFYLMNHSSFIDLEIAAHILYPRPFNIVTTSDAFVGLNFILKKIGCIPTKKFINDTTLVRDIMYAARTLKSNVILYPEASYSFDGTATPLPETTGKLVKLLGIPLVMIRTYGAFSRDPLYNNLQVRKVKVTAEEKFLLSAEEIRKMSPEEINEVINREFSFDNFKWQQENRVKIDSPTRADYLNRVLYKCPHCMAEGKMLGEGIELKCREGGAAYILDEYGYLAAQNVKPAFNHIPDWYRWQRKCVREEVLSGTYGFDIPVKIMMAIDTKTIYSVGEGRLSHSIDGFKLIGCDGKLNYEHKPLNSYSLYSDFNWYEIGDVICIGNHEALYYCFPEGTGDIVAKARLATEEIYKILMERKRNS